MKLRGKAGLVTGAAVRVGREIALALARRGASVAVHYRSSRGPAEATCRAIRRLGVRAVPVQGDLRSVDDCARVAREARQALGRVDLLVNSASEYARSRFGRTTEEEWDRFLNANLRGPFFLTQALAQELTRRRGVVVNVADWAGLRPYPDYLPYCISKAGLIAMTQGLARGLAPRVRVNAVLPGPVLLPAEWSAATARAIRRAVPLRRIGSPADVAAAVVFLVEGSDFVTGALVPVDGGRLIA